jgi:hypothetical protein
MAIGKIGQDDARYADLVRKNFNKRAVGRPDQRLVSVWDRRAR